MGIHLFIIIDKILKDMELDSHPIYFAMEQDLQIKPLEKKYTIAHRKDLFHLNMKNSGAVPETYIINNFEDLKKVDVSCNSCNWFLKPVNIEKGFGIVVGDIDFIKSKYREHIKSFKKGNKICVTKGD